MRPRFPRLACLATAAAAVVATVAGCGSAGTSSDHGKSPIVIGISLSLTGGFQQDGLGFQRGYRLWQNVTNEHGGILGRQVKLVIVNDNSDPNKVQKNYQTLITKDHVDMTFGPFSSLLTTPAAAEAAKHGFAMIEGAGDASSVFQSQSGRLHNIFSPSLPVADYMKPLINWIKSLPASRRPKTAAYPTAQDPFAGPAVQLAQKELQRLGIRTIYPAGKGFPEKQSAYHAPATAVANAGAQMVVLGATDVPTVATFMKVFEQMRYQPKLFIAFSGPDQGEAFLGAVGKAASSGVLVPNGWYGAYNNPLSNEMVEEYIARYGGDASGINADVAEAFSVGQVAADAIIQTGGTNQAKIIKYLHTGVTLETVQGPAKFEADGENPKSAAFISQWQNGNFVQVLTQTGSGSGQIKYPKPNW